VETEALDKRGSSSRPETGIVGIEHRGYNQHGEVACVVRRTALMKRNTKASAEVTPNA
jgi:acyl dehydratase